ncbi:MAG TPA: hypothetical protein P5077_01650 [bacterium]|nr:hypothetical protein [bacterium]
MRILFYLVFSISLSIILPLACATPEDDPYYCETTLDCADGWECIDHSCVISVNTDDTDGGTDDKTLPEVETPLPDADLSPVEDDAITDGLTPDDAVDENTVDEIDVDEDAIPVDENTDDETADLTDTTDGAFDLDTTDDAVTDEAVDIDTVDEAIDIDTVDEQPDEDATVTCESVTMGFDGTWTDPRGNNWTLNCTGTGCINWIYSHAIYDNRAAHEPPTNAETSTAYLVSPEYHRKNGCPLTVTYDYRFQENSTTADSLKLEVCQGSCSSWTTVKTWNSFTSSIYGESTDLSAQVTPGSTFKVRWAHYSPKVTTHYTAWVDNFKIDGI